MWDHGVESDVRRGRLAYGERGIKNDGGAHERRGRVATVVDVDI